MQVGTINKPVGTIENLHIPFINVKFIRKNCVAILNVSTLY